MAEQSRRAFLRAAAVAPVAAPAAVHGIAQQAQLGMAGLSVLGYGDGNCEVDAPIGPDQGVKRIKSFAEWLKIGGERRLWEEARNVTRLDPDILCMRVPLCTMMHWQRKRNYEQALESRRDWFARILNEQGYVNWYD